MAPIIDFELKEPEWSEKEEEKWKQGVAERKRQRNNELRKLGYNRGTNNAHEYFHYPTASCTQWLHVELNKVIKYQKRQQELIKAAFPANCPDCKFFRGSLAERCNPCYAAHRIIPLPTFVDLSSKEVVVKIDVKLEPEKIDGYTQEQWDKFDQSIKYQPPNRKKYIPEPYFSLKGVERNGKGYYYTSWNLWLSRRYHTRLLMQGPHTPGRWNPSAVGFLRSQTKCSWYKAVATLDAVKGDLVQAIADLTMPPIVVADPKLVKQHINPNCCYCNFGGFAPCCVCNHSSTYLCHYCFEKQEKNN